MRPASPVDRGGATLLVSDEMRALYAAWRSGRRPAAPGVPEGDDAPPATDAAPALRMGDEPEAPPTASDAPLPSPEAPEAGDGPSWREALRWEERSWRRDGSRPLRCAGATLLHARLEEPDGDVHVLEVFVPSAGGLGLAAAFLPADGHGAAQVHSAGIARTAGDFRNLVDRHDPGRALPFALLPCGTDADAGRRDRARRGFLRLVAEAGLGAGSDTDINRED